MTRPILHRQTALPSQHTNAQPTGNTGKQPSETAVVSDSGHSRMTRWTDAKAYRPDPIELLANSWANASHRAGRASPEPQSTVRLGHTATIAFAIDALMWAVFAGCFLLIVSGAL